MSSGRSKNSTSNIKKNEGWNIKNLNEKNIISVYRLADVDDSFMHGWISVNHCMIRQLKEKWNTAEIFDFIRNSYHGNKTICFVNMHAKITLSNHRLKFYSHLCCQDCWSIQDLFYFRVMSWFVEIIHIVLWLILKVRNYEKRTELMVSKSSSLPCGK